ncbi:MAG: NAD(P)/FAD-dependent oxidoreductase [Cyanobacteria bacterium J06628_6]
MSQSTAQPVPQSVNSAEDILIVGAGPAGATTALFLAKSGIPHTLIDRATFPRDKADGNVYGSKVIEVLDRLNLDYFPELMAQADQRLGLRTMQVFTPDGGQLNLGFPDSEPSAQATSIAAEIPSFTMNRRNFDHFLVKKLNLHYTQARFGTSIEIVERQSDRWSVVMSDQNGVQQLSPRLVVVADGVNSTVLQRLGCQPTEERWYDSVQGYFRGVTGFERDAQQAASITAPFHVESHFLSESNPGFFFVVPLPQGVFNVGVGLPRQLVKENHVNLPDLLHTLIQSYFAERFADAQAISDLRSWPLVVGTPDQTPVSGAGYLVTGDAAGLCNPLTCFGTGNAMISGMLAAAQVHRSLEQQQFDASTLKAYDQALYDRLHEEFRYSSWVKRFTQKDWIFNLVTNPSVKSLLRQGLRGTATMLKRL